MTLLSVTLLNTHMHIFSCAKPLSSYGMKSLCSTSMQLMLLTEQFRISWKTTLHLVASLYCLVVISDRPFQSFLMVSNSNLLQPHSEEAIFGNMLRCIICIKICILNNHQTCRSLHTGFWRLEQAQILTITHQQFPSHPT